MKNQKLCLSLMGSYGSVQVGAEEELRLIAKAGFDGFFCGWGGIDYLKKCRCVAGEMGMYFQSVHAPFGKCRDLWHGTHESAKTAVNELCACLEDCATVEAPIMVSHTYIGFDEHGLAPNEFGLGNFETIIQRAKELGVKIAFENTEGDEYLDAVMELGKAYPDTVGFCWDTGHEMCYNCTEDMPGRYQGRLIATHINDNLGIRDFGGHIFWLDDLHLLPFDGVGDWEDIARRLKDFDGPLTFELTTHSKPDRHENDK